LFFKLARQSDVEFLQKKRAKNKIKKVNLENIIKKRKTIGTSVINDKILQKEETQIIRSDLEYYPDHEYQADLESTLINPKHIFMKKHFPCMYVPNQFFKNIKMLNEKREYERDEIFIYNHTLPQNFLTVNPEDSSKSQNFNNSNEFRPKKLWSNEKNIKDEDCKKFY
jgi:hypothetical protein